MCSCELGNDAACNAFRECGYEAMMLHAMPFLRASSVALRRVHQGMVLGDSLVTYSLVKGLDQSQNNTHLHTHTVTEHRENAEAIAPRPGRAQAPCGASRAKGVRHRIAPPVHLSPRTRPARTPTCKHRDHPLRNPHTGRPSKAVKEISRYGSPAGIKWAGAEIKKWYGYQKLWYFIPLSEISQTCQMTREIGRARAVMPPKRKERAEPEPEAAPAKKQHGGGDRNQGRKRKEANKPGVDCAALPHKRQMGLAELLGERSKPAPKASEQAAVYVDAASPAPAAESGSSSAPPAAAAAAAASAARPAKAAAPRAQPFNDSAELGPAWHALSGYGDEQLDEERVEKTLKANPDFVKRVLAGARGNAPSLRRGQRQAGRG